jgi:hypothetical protein
MIMQTAKTLESSTEKLDELYDLLRRTYTVDSVEGLAMLVVESASNFSLETSVQIRSSLGLVNVSSSEPMPPLEKELLLQLNGAGRIYESGGKFFINFHNISLMVKNMPGEKYKRAKLHDLLVVVLECVEMRLQSMEVAHELEQARHETQLLLQNIESMQKIQKGRVIQLVDHIKLLSNQTMRQ